MLPAPRGAARASCAPRLGLLALAALLALARAPRALGQACSSAASCCTVTAGAVSCAHCCSGVTVIDLLSKGLTALSAGLFDGILALGAVYLLHSKQLTTLPSCLFSLYYPLSMHWSFSALLFLVASLPLAAHAQSLSVQNSVGPGAGALGWGPQTWPSGQNNAQGPHFMRLSPDGGTLFMVLYDYGSYTTPTLPNSALGPKIVSMAVSDGAVITDPNSWNIVAGGNPTHPCNDGVVDGTGTNAQLGRIGICADPSFDNLYAADYDVRRPPAAQPPPPPHAALCMQPHRTVNLLPPPLIIRLRPPAIHRNTRSARFRLRAPRTAKRRRSPASATTLPRSAPPTASTTPAGLAASRATMTGWQRARSSHFLAPARSSQRRPTFSSSRATRACGFACLT